MLSLTFQGSRSGESFARAMASAQVVGRICMRPISPIVPFEAGSKFDSTSIVAIPTESGISPRFGRWSLAHLIAPRASFSVMVNPVLAGLSSAVDALPAPGAFNSLRARAAMLAAAPSNINVWKLRKASS